VQLTNNGQTSANFTVQGQPSSPSFFNINGGPYVVAQHSADYSLIGPASLFPGASSPAKPGEIVILYANGFGPTTPAAVSGAIAQTLYATVLAPSVLAQRISPTPSCVLSSEIGTYPATPLAYPKTSDRYAVEYSLNGGAFTAAQVYVSYYGATNSTPLLSFSGYSTETSFSFASIPVPPSASIQLRVTKLWDAPFFSTTVQFPLNNR
jgi:hypothetical protein